MKKIHSNKATRLIVLFFFLSKVSFGQIADWNTHGNIADSSSILGNTNYEDLRILTDSTLRMTILKDGDINIEKNFQISNGILFTDSISGIGHSINILNSINVSGELKADSLTSNSGILKLNSNLNLPNAWIHADSLNVRTIHLGDSSLQLSGYTQPGTSNIINTTNTISPSPTLLIEPYNGITSFGNYSSTAYFSHNQVGIGTQTPSVKLHLFEGDYSFGTHVPVYELFTNYGATSGFRLGITGGSTANSGVAEIRQREDKNLNIFTNDLQRMTILNTGEVGINQTAPSSMLEIEDGSGGDQLELTYSGLYIRTRFRTTPIGDLLIKPQQQAGPIVYGHTIFYGSEYDNTSNTNPDFSVHLKQDFAVDNMDQSVNATTGTAYPVLWDDASHQLYKSTSPIGSGWTTACVSGVTLYKLTKWSNVSTNEICESQIWDDGTNIGIGTTTPATNNFVQIDCPSLSSYQVGLKVNNSLGSQAYGIYSTANSSGSQNIGVVGESYNGTNMNRGIVGTASSGINNYGVYGFATTSGVNNHGGDFTGSSGTFNIGVSGRGTTGYVLGGGFSNIGVYGGVPATISTTDPPNYAVFGNVDGAASGLSSDPDYAGYFNGDVATTSGLIQISDSIFKDNIQTLTDDSAMFLIRNLKPKTFDFDTAGYPSIRLPMGGQIGLISEDVQFYLPQLIKKSMHPAFTDSTGVILHDTVSYLGLNYTGLIPICIGGIKQLDSTLTSRASGAQNAVWVDTLNKYEWGTNSLLHNTKIPMIDSRDSVWSIYFTGQSKRQNHNSGNVGIGYNSSSTLTGKLDVKDSTFTGSGFNFINQYAGNFYNTGGYTVSGGANDFAALKGNCDVISTSVLNLNIGGDFYASNAVRGDYGVRGQSLDNMGTNTGVYGSGQNSAVSYGVYGIGKSSGAGGSTSIGTFGSASNGAVFNYGIYGTVINKAGAANFAGYFAGNVFSTGVYLGSDAMLKQNIQPLGSNSAMQIINNLQPKTYNFDTAQFHSMNLPDGLQYGLIADETEQVLPNLVKKATQPAVTDSLGNIISPEVNFKALNYTGIVPLLIAGIKQLDSTNDAQQLQNQMLQDQLNALQQQVQQLLNCCQNTPPPQGRQEEQGDQGMNRQQQIVELNNYAIILDQNAPNPFAEQTTITFKIPTDVKDAQIIFSDDRGSIIKTVQINTRGAGSLLVYASNLSSGIYSYSLLADGKLIDTKKMVCQKP